METSPQELLPNTNYHILGDSAYKCTTHVLTPFRDNGHLQKNRKCTTSSCHQHAYLLKGRFQILKHVNVYSTILIPKIIVACCVLHNICIMRIDDVDIEIEPIPHQEQIYNDRDCNVGVIKRSMAVCDHSGRFLHCYAGHVGSVHDQRVFRLSEVHGYLGDAEKFHDDCHIIGDSAYKLHENLLVPYRDNGHLTERQRNYNFCHASARIAIERAFGFLKGRFRSLLTVLPMRKVDLIPAHIIACCVLHNICLLRGDDLLIAVNEGDADNVPPNVQQDAAQVGAVKRDLICQRLLMRAV
ncbi:hypothetical protein MML48_10g00001239 [Holotrichia oblita]|uniref:Uncharacterized protein n=1 Tax=Holotrichia oblita TaxID=644536 RepID=A0ACB9SGH7_HOLOL|nr:hypothetical protein MML48_10g00001239 [Holotrichia oblita]